MSGATLKAAGPKVSFNSDLLPSTMGLAALANAYFNSQSSSRVLLSCKPRPVQALRPLPRYTFSRRADSSPEIHNIC